VRPLLVMISLAAAGLLALGSPARAATVVPLTLEEMERMASDVCVGTVEHTEAAWDEDHRRIETRVRLRVESRLKGSPGDTLMLVVPGGVVGEIGMRVPGAPGFRRGERVLLLAEPGRAGSVRPVGLFQGRLRIRHDPARGVDLVEAPGPAWAADGAPIPPGSPPSGRPPALELDEVLRRLGAAR
jgi:hypothetical protein